MDNSESRKAPGLGGLIEEYRPYLDWRNRENKRGWRIIITIVIAFALIFFGFGFAVGAYFF